MNYDRRYKASLGIVDDCSNRYAIMKLRGISDDGYMKWDDAIRAMQSIKILITIDMLLKNENDAYDELIERISRQVNPITNNLESV